MSKFSGLTLTPSPCAVDTAQAIGYPFMTAVELGLIEGHSRVEKFGQNPTILTNTGPEDVWAGGGVYTGQPLVDTGVVETFSSDANDTALGTGARTFRIYGLDDSGLLAQEDISLDGTTPVISINQYSRVFAASVLTAGSAEGNIGSITVRHVSPNTNIFAVVLPGINQTTIAAYTIPSDKTGVLLGYKVKISRTTGADGSALVSIRAREPGGVFRAIQYGQITTGTFLSPDLFGGIELPSGTDIKVTVEEVSDNTTSASASFGILLVDV